jgi:hypothetical protein
VLLDQETQAGAEAVEQEAEPGVVVARSGGHGDWPGTGSGERSRKRGRTQARPLRIS